jgi:tRNA A37 threonylcarbamoyladenosine biosynthesis protein TsaE
MLFTLCQASQNQTALMESGSSSSETTLDTNNSVMPMDEIVESQFVGGNEKIARKSLSRLGTMASALEESQLVGREKEKFELINLISKQDDQQTMVISVWGMGGLGKTTLVKEVYQSQELSDLFEKRACVTIMRPFVLNEVLKSIAMQLCEESSNRKNNIDIELGTTKVAETKLLTEELGKLTKRKRFLIVLDDLSSVVEWGMIIQSLPKIENASRIVITTREENIAKHCSEKQECIYKLNVLNPREALHLFTKKVLLQ